MTFNCAQGDVVPACHHTAPKSRQANDQSPPHIPASCYIATIGRGVPTMGGAPPPMNSIDAFLFSTLLLTLVQSYAKHLKENSVSRHHGAVRVSTTAFCGQSRYIRVGNWFLNGC